MRYLVLADVHSNLEALEAVLKHAPSHDRILVCGDIVGYNANPNEVIQILKDRNAIAVRGNHDRVALNGDGKGFNWYARAAILWTSEVLTTESRAWLSTLLRGPVEVSPSIQLVHGSIAGEDHYVFSETDGRLDLFLSKKKFTFYGHTHYPVMITELASYQPEDNFMDLWNDKWLINPGSVGQPRDGDTRTAFAIFDTKGPRVKFFRVNYDYKAAQRKIIEAGLPKFLASRLAPGE